MPQNDIWIFYLCNQSFPDLYKQAKRENNFNFYLEATNPSFIHETTEILRQFSEVLGNLTVWVIKPYFLTEVFKLKILLGYGVQRKYYNLFT